MSTTLLSAFYDIDFLCKVRGGAGREKGRRKRFEFPDFACRPRLLEDLFHLDFSGWEKSWSLQ